MEPNILIEAEERFWRAAGDPAAYASGLLPDAVHVFPRMGLLEREPVLQGVADAGPWESFTIDDPRVVELGSDAAALIYTTLARRAGSEPYAAAITSVYRRTDGRWLLAVHQQTALAP